MMGHPENGCITSEWSRRAPRLVSSCRHDARLIHNVDMTSVCQVRPDAGLKYFLISPLFLYPAVEHTRVSAEVGPVVPTVDPADIRGLGTTLL